MAEALSSESSLTVCMNYQGFIRDGKLEKTCIVDPERVKLASVGLVSSHGPVGAMVLELWRKRYQCGMTWGNATKI